MQLQVLKCSGDAEQQWFYHRLNQSIINLNGNLCLDVVKSDYDHDVTVYGFVQLYECNGWENQKWIIKQNIITNLKGKWLTIPQNKHLLIKEFRL